MKVIFEQKELKEYIKNIIRENIEEMAVGLPETSYLTARIINIDEAYEKSADALIEVIYDHPDFKRALNDFGGANSRETADIAKQKNAAWEVLKAQDDAEAAFRAEEKRKQDEEERARKKANTLRKKANDVAIEEAKKYGQFDWASHENHPNKPSNIKTSFKAHLSISSADVFGFNPEIEILQFPKTALKNIQKYGLRKDAPIESEIILAKTTDINSERGNRDVPGIIQIGLVVNYDDEAKYPLTFKIIGWDSAGIRDNFGGNGVGGDTYIVFNNKPKLENCKVKKCKTRFVNFDWDEFIKVCNKKLLDQPYDSEEITNKQHRGVWGLDAVTGN